MISRLGNEAGFDLDPKLADLDGDGDIDLLAPGRSGLFWFENLTKQSSASDITGEMVLDPPDVSRPQQAAGLEPLFRRQGTADHDAGGVGKTPSADLGERRKGDGTVA